MHPQQLASSLDPYIGQPLSVVVSRFGPPSGDYASNDGLMTFQWDNFGAAQSGMTGCKVLVTALPSYGNPGVTPPGDFAAWMIKSWSSYGSGCR
jgi:hypothetical protein